MELTVAYLKEQFKAFNELYFDNELPEPRLVVSNSRTRLGQFRSFPNRTYCISVSDYYDVEERVYQNVLLHEMIHLYIAFKRLRDTSSHGREFQKIMRWLNEEHGWQLSVSTQTKGWSVAERNRKTVARHVLALQTVDSRCFISVVHHDYVKYIDKQATQSMFVSRHEWFISTDEYFADFPQTRSLRGRRLKQEAFNAIVAKLQEEEKKLSIST